MNRTCAFLLALTVTSALGQTTPPLGIRDKTPQLKAFTHARIFVAPDQVIENGTLVIDSGRVVASGANVNIPAGATVIDLNGRYLYAGFVEPYSDYGLKAAPEIKPNKEDKPIYKADRMGADAWNEAAMSSFDISGFFS